MEYVCNVGSGDITSENFEPAWYLLEKHRFTNFHDLKAGMEHLEGEVEKRAPGTTGFIKRNLSNFIQCFDTLSDILTHNYRYIFMMFLWIINNDVKLT